MVNGELLMLDEEWTEGFEFGKSRSLSGVVSLSNHDFRFWLDKGNFKEIKFFTLYLVAKIVSKCLFINGHGREEFHAKTQSRGGLGLSQFEQGRELLVGNGCLFNVGAEYIQSVCGNGIFYNVAAILELPVMV